MRVSWLNAMDIVNHMTVRVSHVYREGNAVADALAKYGASNGDFWWDSLPLFLQSVYGFDASYRVAFRGG